MATKKKVTKEAKNIKEDIKNTADHVEEKVEDTVENVTDHAKKKAHKAEEAAKDFLNDGKKSVEGLVDKVINEDQINGYWDMISSTFKTATAKDWIVFVVGLIALVWSLTTLWEFFWGIILLLIAIILMNMFFSRK